MYNVAFNMTEFYYCDYYILYIQAARRIGHLPKNIIDFIIIIDFYS